MDTTTIDYAASTASSVDAGTMAGVLAFMGTFWLIMLVVMVIMFIAMWRIFVKAGKPGWAVLIPIYNTIVLLEIVERPLWWVILYFVPIANLVVQIIVSLDLARKFGKSVLFAVLGLVLTPIGFLVLGFDKSEYNAKA